MITYLGVRIARAGGEQTGNAWADVLFGDAPPAGHLPVELPSTEARPPPFVCVLRCGAPPVSHLEVPPFGEPGCLCTVLKAVRALPRPRPRQSRQTPRYHQPWALKSL